MVKCKHCNLVYNDGAFCVKCGQKLVEYDASQYENDSLTHITIIDSSLKHKAPPEEDKTESQIEDMSVGEAHSKSFIDAEIYKAQTEDELISMPTMYLKDLEETASDVQKPNEKVHSDKTNLLDSFKDKGLVSGKKWPLYIAVALLFIFVVIVGRVVYDFNTSQIYDVVDRNISDPHLLAQLVEKGFDENNFAITLDESEINGLIYQFVDYQALSNNFGDNVKELYYDANRQAFVANIDANIAKTSLVFDIVALKNNQMRISNIRVGDREHKYPQNIISFFTGFKDDQIEINDQIFKLEQFEFGEKIVIRGYLQEDYLLELIEAIKSHNDSQFIGYMVGLENATAADNTILNACNDFQLDQTKTILASIITSEAVRSTWLLLMDEDTMQSLFDNLNATFLLSKTKDVISLVNDYQTKRTQHLKDYNVFINDRAVVNLSKDIELIYQNINNQHLAEGLPLKIVASNGKVYSRSLGRYFESENRVVGKLYYDLYALNDEIAIGVENKDGFFYVTKGDADMVSDVQQVASLKQFRQLIGYNAEQAKPAQLLPFNDHEREAILEAVKSQISTAETPYVRYLSSDGQNAFLVYSTVEDVQNIFFGLLIKGEDGSWVPEVIDYGKPIVDILKDQIEKQSFNTRILPPFDIEDFSGYFYQPAEIDEVYLHLVIKGMITDKAVIRYFTRVGDNLYIEFEDGLRVLIIFKEGSKSNYNKLITIDNALPIENYFPELNNIVGFPNYYPTYLFTY